MRAPLKDDRTGILQVKLCFCLMAKQVQIRAGEKSNYVTFIGDKLDVLLHSFHTVTLAKT